MTPSFKKTLITSTVLHVVVIVALFGFSGMAFKKPKKVTVYNVKLVEMPRVGKPEVKAVKEASKPKIAKKPEAQKKKEVQKPAPKPVSKPKPAPQPKTAKKTEDINHAGLKEALLAKGSESDAGKIPDWYVNLIHERISRLWQCPPGGEDSEALIAFEIQKDGAVVNTSIEKPSGIQSFDESAIRAIGEIKRLYPLPDNFGGESLKVHFTFRREG